MEPVQEGVANLVNHCAAVKRGETVLLLNECGEAEADLVDLIAEAVRAAGGREQVMWLDRPERGGGRGAAPPISEELTKAITSADKVISLYPLSDRALVETLGDSPSVLITNTMFRTKEDFASNHARYHWGMANTVRARRRRIMATASSSEDQVKEGVWNLVAHCLDVQKGESVLLLNEYGKIDPELVGLIEDAVKECGAESHSLWGETIERGARSFSKVLVGAILSADKLIMNYNLNREVLHQYVKDRQILRVTNRCLTPENFATEHARFDWRMVRAIFARLEEISSSSRDWHISAPGGTDLRGQVATASDVADAYFVQESEATRLIRVFPGEVYTPVGAINAQGKIVSDGPNAEDREGGPPEAVTFFFEDNRIVRVEGGERADRVRQRIEEMAQTFGDKARTLDSWHGGMNPKADPDPAGIGAVSTTQRMHFHAQTLGGNFGATVCNQTIELDGSKTYENGKLMVLDDPKIVEAARVYGIEDW